MNYAFSYGVILAQSNIKLIIPQLEVSCDVEYGVILTSYGIIFALIDIKLIATSSSQLQCKWRYLNYAFSYGVIIGLYDSSNHKICSYMQLCTSLL